MKYDVIIVGAGPCGYLAAYELKELDSSLKVLVIDKGLEITQRKCPVLLHKLDRCPVNKEGRQECFPACSITNGFGGAGAYSDGKFNITTEFGGWLNDYIDDTELLDLINYEDKINLKFGATDVVTDPYTDKIKEIEKKAMSVGVKLLRSKVRHLGTEENLKILERIYKHLKESVDFMFRTEVEQVILVDNVAKGVVLKNGEVIEANNVILAVGREGSTWLEKILSKEGVKFTQNQVDIGVRVETSNVIMEEINKNLYEGKFIYHTKLDTTVRTFCANPSGHVVMENYKGIVNVNGHSYSDKALGSENTNFALLVSHRFSEPFNEPNEYALKVSSLANQLACGSVIVQRFGDLIQGRRTNAKRIQEGFIRPTLKEAVPGDLSLCMPQKTLSSIIEMIQVLDNITPGIASSHTLLYGVEAKYYSAHPEINNTLEVKGIKNLYVGGDGAGITRGLAQAGACGIYIARNIVKNNG